MEKYFELNINNIENNKKISAGEVLTNPEISGILDYINEQTGLVLHSEDEKITKKAGKRFFNVTLKQNTSESNEYNLLERFTDKYKLIKIEPNGYRRVAIFINDGSKFEKATYK